MTRVKERAGAWKSSSVLRLSATFLLASATSASTATPRLWASSPFSSPLPGALRQCGEPCHFCFRYLRISGTRRGSTRWALRRPVLLSSSIASFLATLCKGALSKRSSCWVEGFVLFYQTYASMPDFIFISLLLIVLLFLIRSTSSLYRIF